MADLKVIEGGAAKAKVGPAVRAALLLMVLVHFGQAIFGGLWGGVAEPKVEAILASVQIPLVQVTIDQLMMVNMFPLVMALLGVLAPLFGWWIYSRIPSEKQTEFGWSLAGLYVLLDTVLSFVGAALSGAPLDAVAWGGFAFVSVVGAVIVALWLMFFMGVGFLIAKALKSKL